MSLKRIETLLKERMGMDLAAQGEAGLQQVLRQRLAASGCATPEAYWDRLCEDPREITELIDAVVVPETWFFRDSEAWLTLGALARQWVASPVPRRLLSAPCSTGEEPYSMAITLLEAGLPAAQFSIEAVDISERSLAHARRGIYGRNSFRSEDAPARRVWFREVAEGREVVRPVRDCVRFRSVNLLAGALGGPFDVIFCRNVLIYFDAETQGQVLNSLRAALAPEGMLFVGAAEAFLTRLHGFAAHGGAGAFTLAAAALPPVPAPPEKPPVPPRPRPARPALRRPPVKAELPPAPSARKLPEILALADAGRLEEARAACLAWLKEHEASADGYCLLGVLHDSLAEVASARAAYRRALYLEPGHPEALRHLALLTEKRGDVAGARRLHRRAVRSEEAASS